MFSHKMLIIISLLSLIIQTTSAQDLHLSEDLSSPEWYAELLRLNPGNQLNDYAFGDNPYATPATGGGNSYDDLNNFQLYFGKYRLFGSIETLAVLPCPLGEALTHKNLVSNVAVAFRLANPAGYIELPELPDAGTITIHARNGNQSIATQLGLEQYEPVTGTWIPLYTFNLKAFGTYPAFRDEVLSYDINSDGPIKLRLINNVAVTPRFINLYKLEVTEKTQTAQ
jgi:hypothetical protein